MEFPLGNIHYATIVRVYDGQKIYVMQDRITKETLEIAARNRHWIDLLCTWANKDDPRWSKLHKHLPFGKGLRDWIILEGGEWTKIIQWAGME